MPTRTITTLLVLLLGLALLPLAAPPLLAEEEAEEIEPVEPAEARRLAKELDRAAKRRKAEDVMPVLDELDNRSDALFVKPLLKMLKHVNSKVALRAAEALGAQRPVNEKDKKKLLKGIWKYGWNDRANKGRYAVQGASLRALGEITKEPVDASQFKDAKRMWERILGDPNEKLAPALVAVCEYVRVTKDKRFCRILAEEIDEPMATAVNSPSNPPASWWEKRWKMWKLVKAEIVETLEELTGESFKSSEAAKEWFKANEKEFGFKW